VCSAGVRLLVRDCAECFSDCRSNGLVASGAAAVRDARAAERGDGRRRGAIAGVP
jgi:hypothetical protein